MLKEITHGVYAILTYYGYNIIILGKNRIAAQIYNACTYYSIDDDDATEINNYL